MSNGNSFQVMPTTDYRARVHRMIPSLESTDLQRVRVYTDDCERITHEADAAATLIALIRLRAL